MMDSLRSAQLKEHSVLGSLEKTNHILTIDQLEPLP